MIDPATGLFEICRARNGTSLEASQLFDINWLCRYPKPRKVICDQGSEFKAEFLELLESYGIERVPSSRRNPQINAIIERIHLVMLNMLRTLELSDVMWDDEDRIWDIYLAKISWAIRSTHNTTLKYSPGHIVLHRDMIVQTQKMINWELIKQNKHNVAVRNNLRENSTRLEWDYRIGDKVLLDYKHRKLDNPYLGPYDIIGIKSNGTVRIQKGRTELTVNIRQLHPFWRRS